MSHQRSFTGSKKRQNDYLESHSDSDHSSFEYIDKDSEYEIELDEIDPSTTVTRLPNKPAPKQSVIGSSSSSSDDEDTFVDAKEHQVERGTGNSETVVFKLEREQNKITAKPDKNAIADDSDVESDAGSDTDKAKNTGQNTKLPDLFFSSSSSSGDESDDADDLKESVVRRNDPHPVCETAVHSNMGLKKPIISHSSDSDSDLETGGELKEGPNRSNVKKLVVKTSNLDEDEKLISGLIKATAKQSENGTNWTSPSDDDSAQSDQENATLSPKQESETSTDSSSDSEEDDDRINPKTGSSSCESQDKIQTSKSEETDTLVMPASNQPEKELEQVQIDPALLQELMDLYNRIPKFYVS